MMGRYHREWTDRLSDYLSDELDAATRAGLEEHLAGCGRCRRVLAELRGVVRAAGTAGGIEPPRDLWPRVAASIHTASQSVAWEEEDGVISLPTADVGRPALPPPSWSSFAAIATLLVVLSIGATWWIASGKSATGVVRGGAGAFVAIDSSDDVPAGLADQLRALEQVLQSARSVLDEETALTLERNLNTIQQAITDSREALAADPGNAFLAEHLERMYRRKLVYLQDAVRVVEWSG